MEAAEELTLVSLLNTFVRRARWQTFARRLTDAAIILGVALPLACLIDGLLPLPPLLRELLFDLLIGCAAARLIPSIARLLTRQTNLVRAAERLERCAPWLEQRLSTLMSQTDEPSPLVHDLMTATLSEIRQRPALWRECTPWNPIRRRATIAICCVCAALLLAHAFGGRAARLLPPWPGGDQPDESILR